MSHFKELFEDNSYRVKQRAVGVLIGIALGVPLFMIGILFVGPSQNPFLFSLFFALAVIYMGLIHVYRQDDLFVPQNPAWVKSSIKISVFYGVASGLLFYLVALYGASLTK